LPRPAIKDGASKQGWRIETDRLAFEEYPELLEFRRQRAKAALDNATADRAFQGPVKTQGRQDQAAENGRIFEKAPPVIHRNPFRPQLSAIVPFASIL
jgi:hypothetical protein